MDLGLEGSSALVTGGSRGIGLAVARALANEGVRVALLGRDRVALELNAEAIGRGAVAVVADTTDDTQVRAAADDAAARLGGIDIVVNGAAPPARQGVGSGLKGLDDDDFKRQVDTKVLGYLRVTRAALRYLVDGGGRVINIGGMNARATGSITGSVRNMAVVAVTKNLADELGPYGVTVTCVHPGVTVPRPLEGFSSTTPRDATNAVGRPIVADEVAWAVTVLASPRAALMNGAVITLDGGRSGPIWA